MEEKDKVLKKFLLKQVELSRPLSSKLIKDLKNPRFSSGKIIKYGDIPLQLLEIKAVNSNDVDIVFVGDEDKRRAILSPKDSEKIFNTTLSLIVLEESEIDYYCKNYLYAGGDEYSIKVIKK